MIDLYLSDVVGAGEAVVADAGDKYVYNPVSGQGCVYAWNGAPSCLVGHILVRLGVDPEDFERFNVNTDADVSMALDTLEDAGVIGYVDSCASTFLRSAQDLQDQGTPWGEALDCAKATVNLR